MILKILAALAAILVVFIIVVLLQPADFKVERIGSINAPVTTVFGKVNDLHQWNAWSPWVKLDPQAKTTFEGPESGTGAIMRWDGNDKMGAGSNTIVAVKPNEEIDIKLEFIRPFAASNDVRFVFKPVGEQTTQVTWTMTGRNGFVGKAVSLFMDCEKMVGPDFEAGLANLKKICEAAPNP